MGDQLKKCDLPVMGLIYYSVDKDTQNTGALETKAETLIADLYPLNESWATALPSLDEDSKKCVESIEIVSIQPYINVGFPVRGEIEFELKIIYYRS